MRAVFFTREYSPAHNPRAVQVGRLAEATRLPVTVVCAPAARPGDPTVPGRALPPGARVWEIPDAPGGWPWPDRHRRWALRAAERVAAEGGLTRTDVLVTFGHPMSDHLAGLRLKETVGAPWVAHFSDPWADNPYRRPAWAWRALLRPLERRVMERADLVLFTSEETLNLVMGHHPASVRAKAAVLPHAHGAGPATARPSSTDKRKIVRYLGHFYGPRSPAPVLAAWRSLLREDPGWGDRVHFEFVGGPPPKGLSSADGVTFRPAVSYGESLRLMEGADLLLNVDAPFEPNVFFPSKLADYIGAGRPLVVVSPPGASARIAREAGGRHLEPGSPAALAAGLRSVLTALVENRLEGPSAAVREALAAARVAALFDAMVSSVARPGGKAGEVPA